MHNKQQAPNQNIPCAVYIWLLLCFPYSNALRARAIEISVLLCMRKLAPVRASWRRVKAVCTLHTFTLCMLSRTHKIRASAVLSLSIAAKRKFAQEHSYVAKNEKKNKQTSTENTLRFGCVFFSLFSSKDYGANWNKQNIHPHD